MKQSVDCIAARAGMQPSDNVPGCRTPPQRDIAPSAQSYTPRRGRLTAAAGMRPDNGLEAIVLC
jgi:hypothetical protein